MRIEFALFAGDALLERSAIRVTAEAQCSHLLLFHVAHIFKANLTAAEWRDTVRESKIHLGKLLSRRLKRVVWYEDPPNAPLPGTYAAVEFDSEYEHTDQHFQYVMLHSQRGAPFRVMRHQSTVLNKPKERARSNGR